MIVNPADLSHESFFFRWLMEQDYTNQTIFQGIKYSKTQMQIQKLQNKQVSCTIIVPPASTSDSTEESQKEKEEMIQELQIRCTRKGKIMKKKNDLGCKEDKDPSFNPKKQKRNRNVLSNLVHHLLKYISEASYIAPKVIDIIRIHQLSLTIEEFFLILKKVENDYKGYVTEKSLKNLWKGQISGFEDKVSNKNIRDFSKIIRVLSSQFYKGNCKNSILFSNKLSLQSKNIHFEGLYQIKDLLFTLSKQDKP